MNTNFTIEELEAIESILSLSVCKMEEVKVATRNDIQKIKDIQRKINRNISKLTQEQEEQEDRDEQTRINKIKQK